MTLRHPFPRLPALLFAVLTGVAAAEDIDLFLNPAGNSTAPNVLLALDNSANWNATLYKEGNTKVTKRKVIHYALNQVLTSADATDAMKVGLIAFAAGNSPKGGKVLSAVDPLTSAYQSEIAARLYDADGNEQIGGTNNAPYALMLNEAYRYYAGLAPRSGTQDGNHDADALDASGDYISPAGGCGRNYVILIGNGSPDSGENNDAESVLAGLGGKLETDPLPVSPDNFASNWADEYARFMAASDFVADQAEKQNVITYVIDVFDPAQIKNSVDEAERSFLKSIAKNGQGRYLTARNEAELIAALTDILEEIQAVNSVFASTTLPVSVNVRGTNLNQVYMGVFRPNANALPRWDGNLKLYRLAYDGGTDTVYLADKNGNPVENPSTGFVVQDAVSYWTKDSSFWSFHPEYAASDSPDGEIVEKGAVAQNLREGGSRNLYTCAGSGCSAGALLSGMAFDSDNSEISQADLGASDATERANIIQWVRGIDLQDEDSDGDNSDVRASVHGDVLHSRPAVINYARTSTEDDIIAFYGGNDGVFRAVHGGKDGEGNDGDELWGFIPEEFFGDLKRLYDNDSNITTAGKPYFVDGNVSVYQDDGGDGSLGAGDDVYLYLSMRRGGRFVYALDVSVPETPKLKWRRSHTDSGWSELGQTWSELKVATINLGGTATPVVVFGAGYDPTANDAEPQGNAGMGRGIFVANAATGDIIWQATSASVSGMDYSIPSDITVVNLDNDEHGYADRAYVGDTGGNLWRVDMSDPAPGNWSVAKFADVGGGRKFLYPPDVVYAEDSGGSYYAILIGSGDREHPASTGTVDRFYMFKDRATPDGWPLAEIDLYDATENLVQDGSSSAQDEARIALDGDEGWYITLGSGEKVVSSAVTLAGTTFFNTNQPGSDGSCSGLGIARHYAVSYEDASATEERDGSDGKTKSDRSATVAGGGFPPSPVPVIVDIDGKKHQAVISGTKVWTSPASKLERRERIYWFRDID